MSVSPKVIAAVTNELLKSAHRKRRDIKGAINWAALNVVCVQKVHEFYGDEEPQEFWRVVIEEVSPDAIEFQAWMERGLKRRGLDVEVETEW